MKRNKRSSYGFAWILLAVIALMAVYYFFPNVFSVSEMSPTSAPTVLSGNTKPTVSIGNSTKTTDCKSNGILPDRECTPGATDPAVTGQVVNGTICVAGYSSKVRPPTSKTNKIKQAQLAAYGFTGAMSDYELDHLISLELGGCPDCVSNLWPEPYNIVMGAREKDKIENYLHAEVCNGRMTLTEAQNEIATDWTAVYYRVYGK